MAFPLVIPVFDPFYGYEFRREWDRRLTISGIHGDYTKTGNAETKGVPSHVDHLEPSQTRRQTCALIDRALGIKLGGDIGTTDDMHLATHGDQRIGKAPVRDLTGT